MKIIALLLVCSILTINLQAQETMVKGVRSWEMASSLIGQTITIAKSMLKKAGFITDQKKGKDECVDDLCYYMFYAESTKNKEYEPDYKLICINDKVVLVTIAYEYESDNAIFKKDLTKMNESLTNNGFIKESKSVRSGDYVINHYNSSKNNNAAAIAADKRLAHFFLILGNPKYVKEALEE